MIAAVVLAISLAFSASMDSTCVVEGMRERTAKEMRWKI